MPSSAKVKITVEHDGAPYDQHRSVSAELADIGQNGVELNAEGRDGGATARKKIPVGPNGSDETEEKVSIPENATFRQYSLEATLDCVGSIQRIIQEKADVSIAVRLEAGCLVVTTVRSAKIEGGVRTVRAVRRYCCGGGQGAFVPREEFDAFKADLAARLAPAPEPVKPAPAADAKTPVDTPV